MNDQETMRRKRRAMRMRKKRRQRNLLIGAMIAGFLLIVVIIVSGISAINRKRAEEEYAREQAELQEQQELFKEKIVKAKTLLNKLYAQMFQTEDAAFAEWFFENCSGSEKEAFLEFSEKQELTNADIYELTGESMYVLSDRYQGLLADEETAASNNIYIKESKEEENVSISVAGDLCLTEDGFVIDHYDEVGSLEECISPEILQITNETDLFYVNHEYTISDRGAPLAGKYYTFRAKPERMSI